MRGLGQGGLGGMQVDTYGCHAWRNLFKTIVIVVRGLFDK